MVSRILAASLTILHNDSPVNIHWPIIKLAVLFANRAFVDLSKQIKAQNSSLLRCKEQL